MTDPEAERVTMPISYARSVAITKPVGSTSTTTKRVGSRLDCSGARVRRRKSTIRSTRNGFVLRDPEQSALDRFYDLRDPLSRTNHPLIVSTAYHARVRYRRYYSHENPDGSTTVTSYGPSPRRPRSRGRAPSAPRGPGDDSLC